MDKYVKSDVVYVKPLDSGVNGLNANNQRKKTLNNSCEAKAKEQVPDIEIFGESDTFKLLYKASSEKEGWMKSTKACEVAGVGVLVQVTTQQRNPDGSCAVAEALSFVPGAVIKDGRLVCRAK